MLGRQHGSGLLLAEGAAVAEKEEFATEWTGRDLYDLDGDRIGTVEDVIYGDATGGLKWLVVETGLFGLKKIMVPAGEVRRSGDRLSVPHTKERVKDAPKVDDEQALTQADESRLCRYYGLQYAGAVDPSADGCEDMTDVRPAG